MPSLPRLLPLFLRPFAAFFTLNLKALTNRKTFPTMNKHVNKSTRDAPDSRFIFKVPRRIPIVVCVSFPPSFYFSPFISNAPFTSACAVERSMLGQTVLVEVYTPKRT